MIGINIVIPTTRLYGVCTKIFYIPIALYVGNLSAPTMKNCQILVHPVGMYCYYRDRRLNRLVWKICALAYVKNKLY